MPASMTTPTEFRRRAWDDVQRTITRSCRRVYNAFVRYGPATTMDIAARIPMSPFTVRPRTTDLYKVGLVELDQAAISARSAAGQCDRGGIYRAVPIAEAQRRWEQQRSQCADNQMWLL